MQFRTHDFAWRGATIRHARAGGGKPILFLDAEDSLGGSQPFLNILAQKHDVIAPDHPGFGASDTPDWFKAIGDAAYFYLDFIKEKKLTNVHVVGASLGGWIAAEIAVRDASAIASLQLIAPLGARLKGDPIGDIFMWTPEENVRNRVHDPALAEAMLAKVRARTPEEATRHLKDRYATARLCWHPRFHNPELMRWLHRIDRPAQIIWGEEDRFTPPSLGKLWQEALPRARLAAIPQCGHLPHVENPQSTAVRIAAFIAETAS